MKTPPEIVDDMLAPLIAEAQVDDLGFWEFVRTARRVQPAASEETIRQAVCDVIESAVSKNLLWSGWPPPTGGYQPWDRPIGELLDYIREQWAALGRDPNPGDVMWFSRPLVAAAD